MVYSCARTRVRENLDKILDCIGVLICFLSSSSLLLFVWFGIFLLSFLSFLPPPTHRKLSHLFQEISDIFQEISDIFVETRFIYK